MDNPYWLRLVGEARQLIARSEITGHQYVGVEQARAVVAVDERLRLLEDARA